ncbi:MAG: hypothetical protein HYU75_21520 [Betaproteobacteria bacterium]|nr:hypothetical protein [Betaproteobacteria bacterium]
MHGNLVGRMLVATVLVFPLGARAQDYPSKPIRIVVPYVSGGGVDITARIVADKLREKCALVRRAGADRHQQEPLPQACL